MYDSKRVYQLLVNWDTVRSRPVLSNIPKHYFKDIKKAVKTVNRNTNRTFKKMWDVNVSNNVKSFNIKGMNAKQLKNVNLGKPAFLVGAGPSLKMNVEGLKGRECIFSSLHSLKYLVENGIRPDYAVVMDAQEKQKNFYDGVDTKDMILLAGITVHNEVLKGWKGKIYFFRCDGEKYNKCGIGHNLTSGGSVMGAMINLAINMGSHRLIFSGVDLSMDFCSGGYLDYADGYVEDKSGGDSFITSDIQGNGLWTLYRMWMYKMYIDGLSLRLPYEFINCTEGGILGAYPEGNLSTIKQMRLCEV